MKSNPEKELERILQLSQALYNGLKEGEVKDDGTRLTGEVIRLLSNKNFYRDECFKLREELKQKRAIEKNSVSRQAWESVQAEAENFRIAAEEYRYLWHKATRKDCPERTCGYCMEPLSWINESYVCSNPNCRFNNIKIYVET